MGGCRPHRFVGPGGHWEDLACTQSNACYIIILCEVKALIQQSFYSSCNCFSFWLCLQYSTESTLAKIINKLLIGKCIGRAFTDLSSVLDPDTAGSNFE